MTQLIPDGAQSRLDVEKALEALRPKLHRYCARMVGSAVDGEDIVQIVLIKALEVLPGRRIDNVESWLFRTAHNAAIDFLRHRKRQLALQSDEEPDMISDDAASAMDRYVVAAGLKTFMRLPVAQRACTILKDVLGYSSAEIAAITGMGVPAVKAALHRGRAGIRALADLPAEGRPPALTREDLSRLAEYVDRFNARDFDAVRDMLADDVRLELVARTRMVGRQQVSRYFHNYSHVHDWRLVAGLVDQRPALLVGDPAHAARPPSYFVLLEWAGDRVACIRDFRHARYVAESADLVPLGLLRGTS